MVLAAFLLCLVAAWLAGAIILAFWVIPWVMCQYMHWQIVRHLKEEART